MRKALILLLFPLIIEAQDTTHLMEVIISDNRIETPLMESGKNVQVFTKTQIAQMPVQNVNDLLQHISGVDFRQRGAWGAQADVSIRGGSFDQCLILLNGIKINDPQTGHLTMNLGIDLASIKQIEVIKGPAAARYGLNAFSGVINIITEPASENQIVVGSAIAQSNNSQLPNDFQGGYNAHAGVHLGTKKSRHFISGSRTLSTGYRPNTDLNRNELMYQSVTNTKLGEFNLMGSLIQNDFGASGYYAYPIDSSSDERVNTYLAAIQHTIQWGGFKLKTKAYLRKNFDTYTLWRESPSWYQNRHRTDVGGAEIHGSYQYKIGKVGVGLEFRQESINSNNLGQWTRNNFGLFAENQIWFLNEKLMLNTGFYVNQSNSFGTQFLPSIELNYKVLEGLNAFASVGQSFRVPTFTDLYYVGPTNIGNPNLKPEQSTNYEAGLKWKKKQHFIQASLFTQHAVNLIDWVRDSVSQPWQPENHEAVTTNGFELNYELRTNLNLGKNLQWNMARVGYTWLNMNIADNEEVISRYALNNLKNQITIQSSLNFKEKLGLTLTGRYLDRLLYTSYWLVDARIQYKLERAKVWIDCTNVLNTHYTEAANAPMPGRWFRLGFDMVLK